MNFIFSILFISTFVILGIMSATETFRPMKYKNCKSKFKIISVDAMGCGDNDRCKFIQDSHPIIRIGFKPDRNTTDLRTSIWANLGSSGALTKFYLENDKTCEGNNITCPLEAGKLYYYSQSVHIRKEYPSVDVQVNWVITNKADNENKSVYSTPIGRDICVKFRALVAEA